MKYSNFILLFFVYALIAVIAFCVARMMKREASASPNVPEGTRT